MEIYLIRHTTPKIEKGVCYGQSDIPLVESFRIEADKLLKTLPKKIEVVYSSPSIRCYQLAEIIESKLLIIDKRLLEMNFGDWEMKKWDDINPIVLDVWMKNFIDVRTPNGENFVDLNNRVNSFLDEVSKQNYKKIAVVTHGGVIRCIVAKVLKITPNDIFKIHFDFASVTKIVFNSDNFYLEQGSFADLSKRRKI